jgi:hypothetical protein
MYSKRPINFYSKNNYLKRMRVYELFRQLFYVSINCQNDSDLGVYELLRCMNY